MIAKLSQWEQATSLSSEEQSKKTHFSETMLHWMYSSFTFGDSASILPYLPPLLPYLFAIQKDKDEEIAKQAPQILPLIAQSFLPQSTLLRVFQSIFQLSKLITTTWHLRATTLPCLQILAFNHRYLLEQPVVNEIAEFMISHLSDSQVEVKEVARVALTSLVRSTDVNIFALIHRFSELVGTQGESKRKIDQLDLIKRHSGVLGICALIASQPYDVPQWMPDLLSKLAAHVGDPHPISDTVRASFAEFWRTHQDMWHILRLKFSEDQLYAINELIISPNYYA